MVDGKLWTNMYRSFLRKRWNISPVGARVLSNFFWSDYEQKIMPYHKIWNIHSKGFTVTDWCFLGLNDSNYKEYMTNVEYCKMHRINGWVSIWIDDKLTLKYICAGTELDKYLPEYYYQIDGEGNVLCLMDCPDRKNSADAHDVAALLEKKGVLAIKLIVGSIGVGFYKGEFKDGYYYLNGEKLDLDGFCQKIGSLRNYLIIEYLRPHKELAEYCPSTVNCIRYLIGRINGQMEMIKGYIRFGTKQSRFVENYNAGGVLCYLDEEGQFTEGNIIDAQNHKNCIIDHHPDTGKELKGKIPMWDEIVEAGKAFDLHFPQMKYLGMDFVVTSDNRVKLLEINSLTSLDGIQLNGSILKTKSAAFYRERMNK